MKFIIILTATLILNACGGSKEVANIAADTETTMNDTKKAAQDNTVVIEYVENTRGYHKMIKITPKTVSTLLVRGGKPDIKPCDKTLWSDLMKEMASISLKELPELEPPSKTHRYDAAAMANLTITKGDETYKTLTFDAGNPHEKIASLVKEILTVVDKKQ